jgi:thymidylate synthase (FAD)
MPVEGCDGAIVQAARVSYGQGTKAVSDDRALIRYLMRHWHTTPFEMVEFKFHIRCPIFVARQWMRHRTASVNEVSARYSIVPEDYFVPSELRTQGVANRQGSDSVYIDIENQEAIRDYCKGAFSLYGDLIESGCARELARTHLPQSTYTEFYWKINLHNLLHFLQLRLEDNAQKEIRDLAHHVYGILKLKAPITAEAFEDFRLGSLTLTGREISAIQANESDIPGKGENQEFHKKLSKLMLDGKT